ncbi:uncharacterized protein BDW43DRAFT_317650 [Aspergillus alliaceus]|uniref:uncharacterized protein n=1 Tax=Petromyces alliaceus TaxID=209559 RepID=UPI0012A6A308|nr:uncharacterized protein BDW43DRAFT_317650 [Aspergillus alliaceus]KAB8239383.1 hypothetical protein BDW43DRAFT_317650 [Aspergillus alliaceus]
MSTHGKEPGSQAFPQVRNLEIRGTWDGEVSGPARLRISLEVHCIPNTQIQVLDTRPASVLFDSASGHFQSESGQNSQPSGCSHRSSLSELFESINPESEAAPMSPKGFSRLLDTANEHSLPEACDEMSSSSLPPIPVHENIATREVSFWPTERFPDLCPNFTKRDDHTRMLNLGKRSATDACLSDAATDEEGDQPGQKTPPKDAIHKSNISDRHLCIQSNLVQLDAANHPRPCSSQGKASKPTALLETAADIQQRSSSEGCLTCTYYMENLDNQSETMVASTTYAQGEQTFRSTSTTKNPGKLQEINVNEHATVLDLTGHARFNSDCGSVTTSQQMSPSSDTTPAGKPETDLEPNLSIGQTSLLDMEQGAGSEADTFELGPLEDHNHYSGDTHKHDDCEFCASKPEIKVIDGVLLVQNPANVRAGIYKIAIIVSIFLLGEAPGGWYDLVIPGLPDMTTGESGFILFLIPEKYGVEFRTTNLRRYKMIEDCLFAEFIHKGDLVVPMRSFDQLNYGIVKDFVLDHEIKASPLLNSIIDGNTSTQPGLSVRYHAICSLRLQQRCFWAEKCCFFLKLDGGPEGYFQCRLQPHNVGIQMITLPANGGSSSIGVSRLRIICSPRDFGVFCITWLVNISFTANHWLPRVHPGTTSNAKERSRSQLRATFARMHVDVVTKEEGYRCIIPTLEGKDEVGPQTVEAWVDCDESERPEQPSHSQHKIPSVNEIPEALGVVWTSVTDSFPTWITSQKGLLFLILGVSFTVCGTLGFLILSHAYSKVLHYPWNATTQRNLHLLDESEIDGQILGGGEPGLECNFVEHLFKQTPGSIGSALRFKGDDTSDNVVSNDQEPVGVVESCKELEEQVAAEDQSAQTVDAPGAELSPVLGKEFALRDKIDYLLGWKGPVEHAA